MSVKAAGPIDAHLRAAEHRLIESFALRRKALPPALTEATGQWKDEPVTVHTRAYEGDAIGYVCVAIATGAQITLGSLLAMPRANRPAPILNANMSWSCARAELTMTVDLVPVRDALERDDELRAIARLLPEVSRLPRFGNRTEWSAPASSLQTRVGASHEADALKAFDGYVSAFVTLLAGATPSAERAYQIRALHAGFLAARRAEEALGILGTIFGRAWGEEYISRVLYPSA